MPDQPHELTRIEEAKAQIDLGVLGFRVYCGAISEGASPVEAMRVVAAFYEGTARANTSDKPPEVP